jgi:sensor histidine kinase YesM
MQLSKLINIFSIRKTGFPHGWFHAIIVLMLFFVATPLHVVDSVPQFLLCKSISLLFQLLLVYINLYILIPYFFQRNRLLYALMLLLFLILFSLASYVRFQWMPLPYVPGYIRDAHPLSSILSIFILFTLVNATIMFFRIPFINRKRKKVEKRELEQLRRESEPEFLRLPIKPHFYFNIMNSIYHSITIDPAQAEDILLQLSEMMQYYIYECSKKKVKLESEIRNIHNYIGLQNMRLASEPGIKVKVSGDLRDQVISPFILITFVENAYKYGVAEQRKDSFLDIQLSVNKNEIQFRAINSKSVPTLNNKSQAETELLNVKKRLELLYPSRHRLVIKDSPNQYAVSLDIQLN